MSHDIFNSLFSARAVIMTASLCPPLLDFVGTHSAAGSVGGVKDDKSVCA